MFDIHKYIETRLKEIAYHEDDTRKKIQAVDDLLSFVVRVCSFRQDMASIREDFPKEAEVVDRLHPSDPRNVTFEPQTEVTERSDPRRFRNNREPKGTEIESRSETRDAEGNVVSESETRRVVKSFVPDSVDLTAEGIRIMGKGTIEEEQE